MIKILMCILLYCIVLNVLMYILPEAKFYCHDVRFIIMSSVVCTSVGTEVKGVISRDFI